MPSRNKSSRKKTKSKSSKGRKKTNRKRSKSSQLKLCSAALSENQHTVLKGFSFVIQHNIVREQMQAYQPTELEAWCDVQHIPVTGSVLDIKGINVSLIKSKLLYETRKDFDDLDVNEDLVWINLVLPGLDGKYVIPSQHIIPEYKKLQIFPVSLDIDNLCEPKSSNLLYQYLLMKGELDIIELIYRKYHILKNYSEQLSEDKMRMLMFCVDETLPYALMSGSFPLIEWLRKKYKQVWGVDVLSSTHFGYYCSRFSIYDFQSHPTSEEFLWFTHMLCNTIDFAYVSGNEELVTWMEGICSTTSSKNLPVLLGKCGSIDMLQKIDNQDLDIDWSYHIQGEAAKSGQLPAVKWISLNKLALICRQTPEYAASRGHLSVLKWCNEWDENANYFDWDLDTMEEALKSGSIEVIRWLNEHKDLAYPANTLILVAGYGHTTLLEWLINTSVVDTNYQVMVDSILTAVYQRNSQVVQYLISKMDRQRLVNLDGGGINDIAAEIVKSGNLPLLKWVMKKFDIDNLWFNMLFKWTIIHFTHCNNIIIIIFKNKPINCT